VWAKSAVFPVGEIKSVVIESVVKAKLVAEAVITTMPPAMAHIKTRIKKTDKISVSVIKTKMTHLITFFNLYSNRITSVF